MAVNLGMPTQPQSPEMMHLLLGLATLLERNDATLTSMPYDAGMWLELDGGEQSIELPMNCPSGLLKVFKDVQEHNRGPSKRPKLKFKRTKIGLRVKVQDGYKTKIVLPFNLWDALDAVAEDGPGSPSNYILSVDEGPWAVKIGIATPSGGMYYLTELGKDVKAKMPPPPPPPLEFWP